MSGWARRHRRGAALVAALALPSGVYNVCRDGDRVSSERFKRVSGWRPER